MSSSIPLYRPHTNASNAPTTSRRTNESHLGLMSERVNLDASGQHEKGAKRKAIKAVASSARENIRSIVHRDKGGQVEHGHHHTGGLVSGLQRVDTVRDVSDIAPRVQRRLREIDESLIKLRRKNKTLYDSIETLQQSKKTIDVNQEAEEELGTSGIGRDQVPLLRNPSGKEQLARINKEIKAVPKEIKANSDRLKKLEKERDLLRELQKELCEPAGSGFKSRKEELRQKYLKKTNEQKRESRFAKMSLHDAYGRVCEKESSEVKINSYYYTYMLMD